MRTVVVILAFCAVGVAARELPAQPAEATDRALEPEPTRVIVSPLVYLRPGAIGSMSALEDGRRAILRGTESYVARSNEHFEFVPYSRVEQTMRNRPTHEGQVDVARGFADIGFTKYRELEHAAAVENLRRAYSEYRQAGQQFIDPSEVAEVLLFQALASLDTEDDPMQPLDVMKQMIVLDPAREMTTATFPREVVTFYESARLQLERDVRERGPDERLAQRLVEEADADYVLVANALPNPDASVDLVLWLYDARDEQFRTSSTLTVRQPTPDRLEAGSNMLASRLLSCLVEPEVVAEKPVIPKGSGEGRFTLNLNFAYASYYSFPDVAGRPVVPFDHMGAAIGGGWFLTREFALVAIFQFLTSTSEFSGLVEPGFTTLRGFAGGELGIGFGRFRLSLGTMLEIVAVSQVTTCPGDSVEQRRACDPAETLPSRHLFGINARPRASFRVLDAMRLYLAGSESFYFIPLAGNEFNFLTTGELGLQYRF